MLSYITIGANDVPRSGRFYTAILTPLGYEGQETMDAVEFSPPRRPGRADGSGAVYVKKPFDGKAASVGNGSMAAFEAETQEMVRRVHAAGVAAGGSDDGAPGFRDAYGNHFYVGYLRDPVGNKVAIYCANPAESARER